MAAMDTLDGKRQRLREELEATAGVMVAFSGGADSTFLLAAAAEALGERAVAATGVSPSLAEHELADARLLASELGVRHVVVATHELQRPGYTVNGPDRCYFCKSELFDLLVPLAQIEGLALAVGTNTDDLGDSRRMGLRTADKPAAACLASRVAYGIHVTSDRLSRIERAEALLRSFGLSQLRVRDHGDLARIEVPLEALGTLVQPGRREQLVEGLHRLGFDYVTLDLEGFRSGSMNAALPAGAAAPAR